MVKTGDNFSMGENCGSSEPLDYWRKFFRCTDADIFKVIKNAILVASSDRPDEFLARRDEIAKVLFTSLPMHGSSVGSEVQTPEGGVHGYSGGSQETPKESNNLSSRKRFECSNVGEFDALMQQQLIDQVFRIKQVLDNWQEESEKVLSELLGRLQLMKMSVKILNDTKIGIVVRGMQKHKSKSINLLARTLVKGWKRLAEDYITAASTQVNTLDSVNPPPSKEKSLLPSELDFPRLDGEALEATQPAFEISEIFNGMDEDGNPTSTRELRENGSMPQNESNSIRKDKGDMKGEELNHQEIQSGSLPKKLILKVSLRNTQRQNHSEELRRSEVVRRVPKSQETPVNAAANRSTPGMQKSSCFPTTPGLRKDVSKDNEESIYEYRLEEAKRKLQDRYEEAKNAKKQRTVQVVEWNDLPKQGLNNSPRRRNNGGYLKRSTNMKAGYIL